MYKTVFVTGATGFVGAHLVVHLLKKGYKIKTLKRINSDIMQIKYIFSFYNMHYGEYANRIEWVNGDIMNIELIADSMIGVDYVFHCAADVGLGGMDNRKMTATNIEGTRAVVLAAKRAGVKRFCYISSIATLGNERFGIPITENSEWNEGVHHNPYAISKREAEKYVLSSETESFHVIVVNPGPILGVSAKSTSSSKIIYLAKKGVPFSTLGGSGYVNVRDVCRAMILLTEKDIHGERFILTGFNCSNHELLTMLSIGFSKMKPIAIPRCLVLVAGNIVEFFCRLLHVKCIFDRNMALSVTNRCWYDNSKINRYIHFEYTSIQDTVNEICGFMNDNCPDCHNQGSRKIK